MIIRRWQIVVFLVAFLGGGILLASRTSCGGPTKVERRVDSTLATVPAWRDTVRARDSVIAVRDRQRAKDKLERLAERKRADAAEAKADSLRQWADDLAEVPTNLPVIEQNTRLRTALGAQIKASAQLRIAYDSLKVHRERDGQRLASADSTIQQLQRWRAEDLRRIDRLTLDLSALRDEGKKRGQFLGFFPHWVDEALLVTGGVTVGGAIGYAIGRAAS